MDDIKIVDLLNTSANSLPQSDSARLDVEVLLASVLDCERSWLYSHGETVLDTTQARQFEDLLNRRRQGEPIAYLTGIREFWSMPLHVNTHTLIPRPETECLVEQALSLIPVNKSVKLLDPGTGSGAIALALAQERPAANIIATDIDKHALNTAKKNADVLGLSNIRFLQSHWFEQLAGYQFDLIISNPPYIKDNDPHLQCGDVRFEPSSALRGGEDGMRDLRILINEARHYLTGHACLMLEHGFDQGEHVCKMMEENNYDDIWPIVDLSGHHRGTVARYKT